MALHTLKRPVPYDGGSVDMGKRSADSEFMLAYWTKVQDIVAGRDKVVEKSTDYLPRFPHEDVADYQFRLDNAKFTNVYRDILEGLASKPFERELQTHEITDEDITNFCDNVDGSGNNLTVFAVDTFFSGVNSALDWIFVDYSNMAVDPQRPRSRADEKAMGVRPFWSHVAAINVLEVRSAVVNGSEKLTYMRILEPGAVDHVRVLYADEAGARWELYQKTNDNGWTMTSDGPISIGIIPLVPFITGRRMGRSWRFHPMMKDAADAQIELYQAETGLKHIKALTAYPMLAGQGVNAPKDAEGKPATLKAGPGTTIFTGTRNDGGPAGNFEWLTPDAGLLKFLADDVKALIDQLRELGRQPLTAQSGNLTVITTAVAAGKANSAVQMWALGLKDAIENALVITAKWMKKPDTTKIEVDVFDDFEVAGEGGEALSALATARANKDISGRTYTNELMRRNVLSAEYDYDTDAAELLKEVPLDGNPDITP